MVAHAGLKHGEDEEEDAVPRWAVEVEAAGAHDCVQGKYTSHGGDPSRSYCKTTCKLGVSGSTFRPAAIQCRPC